MLPLLLVIGGAMIWAWATGRLRNYTYEDGIALALFLLGVRLFTTGRLVMGAALMAGTLLWGAYRHNQHRVRPSMPVEDARALLGVGPEASLADIRAAHRRLIARLHPDAGGSSELANRVNVARDILVADLSRRTPSAS
ncbi:J domain-containing protein [Allosphingosinicella indica]|uniref:J domain-containing protein n=1 Tax=Allosphingosinicella indica TaxID=941907 RepID=A0A1X7G0K1_9SPHN|nr:hypothetical protein [Allosphingosinicella indica]SMF61517.1 hypothetical protein SAMN06295910_0507 [Allosphingosinicella indica]